MTTDDLTGFTAHCDAHAATLHATRGAVGAAYGQLRAACVQAIRDGGKILWFGNGGSAADAQHLAAELVVRYRDDRPPIAALALTTDTSVLTAGGNDLGFEQIFARQITALGRAGDVAIGISTSGHSANVRLGLEAARAIGMVPAALGGRDGGALVGLADPYVIVPSTVTAHIQEMHIMIGHILCADIEQQLGYIRA